MNPMLLPMAAGALTSIFGSRVKPKNYGMMAANMMPGLANSYYNNMWQTMGGGLTANAMQGAAASQGALRSSMAGTGMRNTGLGKTQLALGAGQFFNNQMQNRLGLNQLAWQQAMAMAPYIAQGAMGQDQMRYGLMGAGINAMGNAAMNWGGKR